METVRVSPKKPIIQADARVFKESRTCAKAVLLAEAERVEIGRKRLAGWREFRTQGSLAGKDWLGRFVVGDVNKKERVQ